MTTSQSVKLTANFECNLGEIEAFLLEAKAPHAFDALLGALTHTVVPNLEQYPDMGHMLLARPVHSVEVAQGINRLMKQFGGIGKGGELRQS